MRATDVAATDRLAAMTVSGTVIAEEERRAREILAAAGCSWLPTYSNTKVTVAGAQPRKRIPAGNTHAVMASDMFVIEVDDEAHGLPLYQDLLEECPPTLSWRSRRGPKVIFRLPSGAQRLQHGALLFSGVEVLTNKVMAPGSTVDGFYVTTTALRPIATIDVDLADMLATFAPATTAPPSRMTFQVKEHRWGPGARRRRAAGRAPGSDKPSASDVPDAALERRASWLAESRRYHRFRAQYSLALQMQRFAESFESFVELVTTNSVGANLQGKGDPRARLSRTWESAGREVQTSAQFAFTASPESRAVQGRPDEAHVWLAHTRQRIEEALVGQRRPSPAAHAAGHAPRQLDRTVRTRLPPRSGPDAGVPGQHLQQSAEKVPGPHGGPSVPPHPPRTTGPSGEEHVLGAVDQRQSSYYSPSALGLFYAPHL